MYRHNLKYERFSETNLLETLIQFMFYKKNFKAESEANYIN